MDMLLDSALGKVIRHGSLDVITASGQRLTFGDRKGAPIVVRFTDRKAQWAFMIDPYYYTGKLFMDERLRVEQGTIYDFLEVMLSNARGTKPPLPERIIDWFRFAMRHVRQYNVGLRAKRNVARHYDLDGRLYDLFLDSDKQYSCAYFEHPGQDLEEAQLAKKRHITAKLLMQPGHRVLDIGCGWGGLAIYLASMANVEVRGITLSEEQLAAARAKAHDEGLEQRASFALEDYRTTEGRFDRIVSVGMLEHVGVDFFDVYFQSIRWLLKDDGVALVHAIFRPEGPGRTNPWIQKYIFPGGYIPALSEVLPAVERSGLLVTDIEILRLHYAETLRAWRERFMARRAEAVSLYDERFCRMWEFYLAGSETAFRYEDMAVFQIQLTKNQNIVPLVRDYVTDNESALRKREELLTPVRLAGE
ncbi:replicative DNA helicase [Agaricicola taiwanensis]|uniref:Replicative DNA helicase n=1 Tax=Agaricicola taiwanensis TaxID=591372 RepID=A0A8J2YJ28_9RHOB|nr:cyclopropane-fatty-acyl-phospholipid synthase family protein [Agaricicola taiwanensis]GGE46951.1 replicative DNA helicase [Agaricicola taiwanensis]